MRRKELVEHNVCRDEGLELKKRPADSECGVAAERSIVKAL